MNEAVEILWDLRHGDPEKQTKAAKQAGTFVLERSYFPEALPLLIELLEQEATPKLAEEVAWALWKFKDRRAIPVLLKKARESLNPKVKEKSIRSLGLLEASEAISFLREVASKKLAQPAFVRVAALAALGHFREKSVIAVLENSLEDKEISVRKEALASLGRFLRRDPKSLSEKTLKRIKKISSPFVERSAEIRIEALTILSYGGESFYVLLEKAALKDPDPAVRKAVLSLLFQWPCEKTEAVLLKGLEDLSWGVRYRAGKLLSQAARSKMIFNQSSVTLALKKISQIFPSHILSEVL